MWRSAFLTVLVIALGGLGDAGAETKVQKLDARADERLRAMSAYLASVQSFSFRGDNSTQLVTKTGQKLDMTADSKVTIRRPDRIRADRDGELAGLSFYYDGKSVTLFGNRSKLFATAPAPETIEKTADFVSTKLDLELPAADLIRNDAYAVITKDVLEGRFIAEAVIDGVRCDHLALRGRFVDTQLWIEQGQRPLPHKYVIVSKRVFGAPEYTVSLRDWNLDAKPGDELFTFKAPEGATKINFRALEARKQPKE